MSFKALKYHIFSVLFIKHDPFLNRDVDQVHDMMDDIAEQQDVAREISDAISNPVAFGQDVDEDDLLKELEELEQEELDKELLGVATPTPELPSVPVGEPSKAKAKAAASESSVNFFFGFTVLTIFLRLSGNQRTSYVITVIKFMGCQLSL